MVNEKRINQKPTVKIKKEGESEKGKKKAINKQARKNIVNQATSKREMTKQQPNEASKVTKGLKTGI